MQFQNSIHNGNITINVVVTTNPQKNSKYTHLIKFFDARYPQTSSGQFISEYYSRTFLEHSGGLNLAMDCSENWFLSQENVRHLQNWLRKITYQANRQM